MILIKYLGEKGTIWRQIEIIDLIQQGLGEAVYAGVDLGGLGEVVYAGVDLGGLGEAVYAGVDLGGQVLQQF